MMKTVISTVISTVMRTVTSASDEYSDECQWGVPMTAYSQSALYTDAAKNYTNPSSE
jgi:hypothetical protein